ADCQGSICDAKKNVCVPGQCGQGRCPDPDDLNAECVDTDGDGYGPMCDFGEDCDEDDPIQVGLEFCGDMRDNDCDEIVDEGPTKLCGCDNGCNSMPRGNEGESFDPEKNEADGVGLNDKGELVLDSTTINTKIIWVANTAEGTVSKIDTDTFIELGRYRTAENGPASHFSGNDPSRTSVNVFSDVYVGNRHDGSVTKISALGARCPDKNGDGVVTTSVPGTMVGERASLLDWQEDECVLWHTELPADGNGKKETLLRAVAAQDVTVLDGSIEPVVWAGAWDQKRIYKLDGETGEVLLYTDTEERAYGAALDAAGNLWLATRDGYILRIDTNMCTTTAACAQPWCTGEGGMNDGCMKQRVPTPSSHTPYGITVDSKQRVWIGGSQIHSYDPSKAMGSRWGSAMGGSTSGIAADGLCFIYAARSNGSLMQVDGDDPSMGMILPGTDGTSYGVAVDLTGKVWGIPNGGNANGAYAPVVVTPTQTLGDVTVTMAADTLAGPYTYSDMTGAQLRLATNPRGYYRQIYEGCPGGGQKTLWGQLDWTASTPEGTALLWRVRTAKTEAGLSGAKWITVAMVPGDKPPVDLQQAFSDAGVEMEAYLELEVQLVSERDSDKVAITPIVQRFDVSHSCSAGLK
ncbi:MAG: hypothetical protein KC416_10375, partial [Myxococcales bacterium]|nr:hypothetical protein [Myxococcales bacterium]